MAYEKQTWQTGDVVTSAKLNHMEDGIAGASSGGGSVVWCETTYDSENDRLILDKTYNELVAIPRPSLIIAYSDEGYWYFGYTNTNPAQGAYLAYFFNNDGPLVFGSLSPDENLYTMND